jgi:hypothetical protein
MILMNTAVYLSRLLGTKVTVNLWPPPTSGPVSETWEITEKIKEEIRVVSEGNTGVGPAYARGEFRCRSSEDGKKLAVLKIYKQIPFAGSEGDDPEDRKPQAVEPFEPQELVALKSFKKRDCPIVPELLGYQLTKQSMMTNVPGGCLMYLVWKQVPGESLTHKVFWEAPLSKRAEIRSKFRQTYEYFSETLASRGDS